MHGTTAWEPPPIRPKRKNAILRIYDAPPYRDWAAWLTVCMGLISGFSIGFSKSSVGLPVWLNTSLAVVFFVSVFGIVPAVVRLQVRRVMWRRQAESRKDSTEPPSSPENATVENAPARAPRVNAEQETSRRSAVVSPATRIGPAKSSQVSVSLDSGTAVNSSLVLKRTRDSLQFPIARAVRALQVATSSKERYDRMIDAADALLVTLGIVAVGWLRSERIGSEEIQEFRDALLVRGVSQGHWNKLIVTLGHCSVESESPLLGAVEGLRRMKKGRGDLLANLDSLIAERNRSAHGGRPRSETEANLRVSEFFPLLEVAVDRAAFLAESPWFLVRSSSYRRQHDFRVTADRVMGDHPEFETYSFESAEPLVDDNFYMKGNRGSIDLSPLVVSRYCEECHEEEVFYADKVDKVKGVSLKSFGRGHVIFDRTLDEEIRALA